MSSFRIYLLRKQNNWQVLFPENREDVGHAEFWERSASHEVASYHHIPQSRLKNLPYCLRRARVVGDVVYYGEKQSATLLRAIRKALGNKKMDFQFDDHEKRLPYDVAQFNAVVREFSDRQR